MIIRTLRIALQRRLRQYQRQQLVRHLQWVYAQQQYLANTEAQLYNQLQQMNRQALHAEWKAKGVHHA